MEAMIWKDKEKLLNKIERLLEAEPDIHAELLYYVTRLERSINWEQYCQTVSKNDDEFE